MATEDFERRAEILSALEVFVGDGQVTELRAFPPGRGPAVCGVLYRDLGAMAARALAVESNSAGVYFVPNPIRPELLPADLACRRGSAKADSIASREWLLVDTDPSRVGADGAPLEGDQNATEAERGAAWDVSARCRAVLETAGLAGAVVGDSGNGWHLCYPVALPNDEASYQKVSLALAGLESRCGNPLAHVDQKVKDASRVWKLYGTAARKGPPTAERPHRFSRLIEGPKPTPGLREANTAALERLLALWKRQDEASLPGGHPAGPMAAAAVVERAREYLKTIPGSVSGSRGHAALMWAARVVVYGFDLGVESGFSLLWSDFNGRCQPEWSEKEIRHKCREADAKPYQEPRGWLLSADKAPAQIATTPAFASPGKQIQKEIVKLTFAMPVPASQLKQAVKSEAAVWDGFLYRGEVTLLTALWKAGKTTLLAHMLRAMESGGLFLDQQIKRAKVLYVTEESESRWAERVAQHSLCDLTEFQIRPFKGKARLDEWEAFLGHVKACVEERGYDAVIFDTLASLWPVRDENDASACQATLMPLHDAIGERAAMMLVHHNRKGDGAEATASRGSGALTGFVDTIVEFRRYAPHERKDRRRILSGYGRHDETPQELVIELKEGGYVALGDKDDIQGVETSIAILASGLLPGEPPGKTHKQIHAEWPENDQKRPGLNKLRDALREGAAKGSWKEEGDGKRGGSFTYWAGSETIG